MKANPALVYSTASTSAEVNNYLRGQRLYRWDDLVETDTDLDLPPEQRPVLRRIILLAQSASASTALGETDVPKVFVADHLSALGPNREAQTAVVGALMECGFTVHTDFGELDRDWYYNQVQALGYAAFGPLQAALLDQDTLDMSMLKRWADACTGGLWFEPSSRNPRNGAASERARELVDGQQLSFTEAAHHLTVEGHANLNGRVRWYSKAVREAYEAGQ